jgi:hypothetical protein
MDGGSDDLSLAHIANVGSDVLLPSGKVPLFRRAPYDILRLKQVLIMVIRASLVLILFFVLGNIAYGQNYREQFVKLFSDGDFARQYTLLQSWEKAAPDDPELYVSFFNHYFAKSRRETVSLTTAPPEGASVAVRKENDDKVVGYLGSNVSFTKADFDAGILYIDRGITKFPDRLDMRFGKTYALGQIGDFERFTDEIVKAIDRSDASGYR